MTSPYVTGPASVSPPAPAPIAPRREWWRAALSVLVCLAGVVGAVIAGFIALITWSGCFIGCTGENHVGGALLGLLAAVSLASGPAAVSGLYRSAAWMRVAVGTLAVAGVWILLVLADN